jgi:hypothetical protein
MKRLIERKRRMSLKKCGRFNEAGFSESRSNENRAGSKQGNSLSAQINGRDDTWVVVNSAWDD